MPGFGKKHQYKGSGGSGGREPFENGEYSLVLAFEAKDWGDSDPKTGVPRGPQIRLEMRDAANENRVDWLNIGAMQLKNDDGELAERNGKPMRDIWPTDAGDPEEPRRTKGNAIGGTGEISDKSVGSQFLASLQDEADLRDDQMTNLDDINKMGLRYQLAMISRGGSGTKKPALIGVTRPTSTAKKAEATAPTGNGSGATAPANGTTVANTESFSSHQLAARQALIAFLGARGEPFPLSEFAAHLDALKPLTGFEKPADQMLAVSQVLTDELKGAGGPDYAFDAAGEGTYVAV